MMPGGSILRLVWVYRLELGSGSQGLWGEDLGVGHGVRTLRQSH